MELLATLKNKVAQLRIIGHISNWRNSSEEFVAQIDQYVEQGITDVHLYVKSEGGSVLEAAEIVNVLARFKGKKTGTGGAIVASAATYIVAYLDEFELHANSKFMIHKPHGGMYGNEDQIESNLKLLKDVTNEYRTLYAKKMGISDDELEAMWVKGDQWFTAQEALDKGLVSAVLNDKKEKVSADFAAQLVAMGMPHTDDLIIEKQNNFDMKINAVALGLHAQADETAIQARINELLQKEQDYKNLQTSIAAEKKAQKDADIQNLISAAIADKRIDANQKTTYMAILESNFAAGKAALEALQPITPLSAQIGKKPIQGTGNHDWTYADWSEKDPEGLEAMFENDKARFDALQEAHYR